MALNYVTIYSNDVIEIGGYDVKRGGSYEIVRVRGYDVGWVKSYEVEKKSSIASILIDIHESSILFFFCIYV